MITLPYVNKLSEKIARVLKEHKIRTVHKPSTKIKNTLFNHKDKVHKLDKSGVVYEIRCKRHNEVYVGETGVPMKERGYEHRIIDHKDAKRSHSLRKEEKEKKQSDRIGCRHSSRIKEPSDYKVLNEGRKLIINTGGSEVAEHMQQQSHGKDDIDYDIIGNEDNWFKRGIKEAIEIRKRNPTLNADEGRYHLSPIWFDAIDLTSHQTSKRTRCSESLQDAPSTSEATTVAVAEPNNNQRS